MLDPRHRSIASICLLAAIADGRTSTEERERIRKVCSDLGSDEPDLAGICSDVLLGKRTIEQEVAALDDPALRQTAFEMALCVCDADGATGPDELKFLERLGSALDLPRADSKKQIAEADRVANRELDDLPADLFGDEPTREFELPRVAAATGASVAAPVVDEKRIDGDILRWAGIAAALELLPQKLATVAILPLQMKMVYGIGKSYGYELDRGHIKEFIATIGAGFASQTVERFARGIIGGLAKKMFGGVIGSVGGVATGAAMTYGTTYALGQVAKRYYASGRTISMDQLKAVFAGAVEQGRTLYTQRAPQIAAKAKHLDVKQILGIV